MKMLHWVLVSVAFAGVVFISCSGENENVMGCIDNPNSCISSSSDYDDPYISSDSGNPNTSSSTDSANFSSSSSDSDIDITQSSSDDAPYISSSSLGQSSSNVSNSSSSINASISSSSSIISGSSSSLAVSSSSARSSSSAAASGGSGCVEPMYGVPPNGVTSCITVNGKCYTCNPARGTECASEWIWEGGNVSDSYWYMEVSCAEAGGGGNVSVSSSSVTSNASSSSLASSSSRISSSSVAGNASSSSAASTLTCGSINQTVIEGTSVTAPTVQCGSNTVTSGITWSNAPNYWSAVNEGTYNNIRASATCSGTTQTANCSGTLTVNPKLTCGSVAQTITTSQTPTKPSITCGSISLTTGITWNPNINNALSAGTYSNVTATATSGNCNGQTATCSGTITVNAASTSSSSSAGSSNNSLTPLTSGGAGWASRYWDGCKPSCGWSGNAGGNPTRSCGSDGTTRLSNDAANKCMDNGPAHTCYSQVPFVVGDVAYAFAASHTNGDCGKCFQLTFRGTSEHSSPAGTLSHISGKSMIIKISNIGGDVQGNQFDLMIPGGGLGAFDGFTMQTGVNSNVVSGSTQYGGFVTDCINSNGNSATLSTLQTCLNNKCESAFTNSDLISGCKVYASWFGVANNPQFYSKQVDCPSELNNKW